MTTANVTISAELFNYLISVDARSARAKDRERRAVAIAKRAADQQVSAEKELAELRDAIHGWQTIIEELRDDRQKAEAELGKADRRIKEAESNLSHAETSRDEWRRMAEAAMAERDRLWAERPKIDIDALAEAIVNALMFSSVEGSRAERMRLVNTHGIYTGEWDHERAKNRTANIICELLAKEEP
jgi:chromosome segregation ATPase